MLNMNILFVCLVKKISVAISLVLISVFNTCTVYTCSSKYLERPELNGVMFVSMTTEGCCMGGLDSSVLLPREVFPPAPCKAAGGWISRGDDGTACDDTMGATDGFEEGND